MSVPHPARIVRGQALPADTPAVPVAIVGGGACGMTAAVRLRLDHGMRTYKGSPVATVLPQREDTLSIAALALEWEPIRALRLMATVQRDERQSNRSGADYRANVYGIAAQASF